MTKTIRRPLLLLAIASLSVPLWAMQAESYSPYLDQVRTMHPAEFACNICHDANHTLTQFGKDFAGALVRSHDPYEALQAVENLDSDGDGIRNREELDAGTLPQDRFSMPQRPQAQK